MAEKTSSSSSNRVYHALDTILKLAAVGALWAIFAMLLDIRNATISKEGNGIRVIVTSLSSMRVYPGSSSSWDFGRADKKMKACLRT
ncbi:uncharacterized protein B0I36DRAFT_358137 [Microdochium trichocladiopsis]|uniref:Uncharacterized protein n=1 Tax=Microdochium trichocladiopsis TaxID=1682393 RepID=A0A9P8YK39_9PEZI|nr:uncharacterized protein B0I36DRAFT_358137 [Microdochium trichocladiopsis]KAH7040906.1 hypothetical protein B0I36DRAFT_358137 [Microdochium trichocladiopsis]